VGYKEGVAGKGQAPLVLGDRKRMFKFNKKIRVWIFRPNFVSMFRDETNSADIAGGIFLTVSFSLYQQC